MSQQPPSIGRIVLFRSENHGFMTQPELAAIICALNSEDDTVNLRVFADMHGNFPYVRNVPYNDNLGAPPNKDGYWRWPPRVGA